MLDRPARRVAIATPRSPALTPHRTLDVVWCRTVPELVVLARSRRVDAVLVEHGLEGVDLDLVASLAASSSVALVDPRTQRPAWEAVGAAVIADVPADAAGLANAIALAELARASPGPARARSARRAALVTVIEAPGGGGAGVAAAFARSVAAAAPLDDGVVLADLTLHAMQRRLHGLDPSHRGLPELVMSSRFGPPPPGEVRSALHRISHGVRLLPGLHHHRDWVSVGGHAAQVALDAVRSAADVVVAYVDPDLEGEADTGSFDIEDRNILARTAVAAADLVVVSGRASLAGRIGLLAVLSSLDAFAVPRDRTLALTTGPTRSGRRSRLVGPASSGTLLHHREGDRVDLRIGRAVRTRLAALGAGSVLPTIAPIEPRRVEPGALGHWAHGSEGWITPRVPQQP